MQELNFEEIGQAIRASRIEQHYTQEYVAEQVGVNVSHISNIENNRVKVSLTTLVAICNVLNLTVDYILKNEYAISDSIDREILKELAACSPEKKEKILKIIRIESVRNLVSLEAHASLDKSSICRNLLSILGIFCCRIFLLLLV